MSRKYVAKQRARRAAGAAQKTPQQALPDAAPADTGGPVRAREPALAERLGLSLTAAKYLQDSHPQLVAALLSAQADVPVLDFAALPAATREFLQRRVFPHQPALLAPLEDAFCLAERAQIEAHWGPTRLEYGLEDMLGALRAAAGARAARPATSPALRITTSVPPGPPLRRSA